MNRQLLITDDGVIDAVVGYRAWELWLRDGTAHLSSVARREVEWKPGEVLRKDCRCSLPTLQKGEHTCGIYAWRNPIIPASPRLLGRHAMAEIAPNCLIVGEVLLWGSIDVHVRGYRAQFGKPSAFYVTIAMTEKLRRQIEVAAIQWDVPVVTHPAVHVPSSRVGDRGAPWAHPYYDIEYLLTARDYASDGLLDALKRMSPFTEKAS